MKTIREEIMFEAGLILRSVFNKTASLLNAGTNLAEVDSFVFSMIKDAGARSALAMMGFPGQMSFAINTEVIQIPHKGRILQAGDLISLDMTLFYKGFFVDKAISLVVEPKHYIKRYLVTAVNSCLNTGIKSLKSGMRISEIGRIIESQATALKVKIGKEFFGHTIGESHHMKPLIPNIFNNNFDILTPYTFITIEPIVFYDYYTINYNGFEIHSNVLSAHAEETLYVGKDKVEVIT
jgi:methionyl aminopeptidase